ncbi:9757_t:CDS:2, partial [Rhizophagus irregularis]
MEEQNFELKALMEYNSAEEFFDSDSKGTSNKSNKSCEVSESETSETLGSGTNSSEITIYVSKTFQSWEYVEKFMQRYASVKGHGVRIGGGGRVDKKTCQILKRTYLCQHADESKASTFCKVSCSWKLNIWAKKDKNYLEVTTFKDQHVGHKLSPLASQFVPTLQKLSEEILQEIRFLTVVAKVNATVQYRIIRKKFKTRIFQTDLYNAIDKFRREAMPARAFTNKYFTAGVQSTSRSEGENSTLKRLFKNSSLSLCELFDALEERYQEENNYCDFVSWKKSVPQIGSKNVFKSIFRPVVKQLTEFVFPNIIKKQEEQMDLSLCYHAVQIVLKNALPREKEFVELEHCIICIDNLFDCSQAQLSSFLVDIFQVLEIWEVNHLVNLNTSHFICLLDNGTFLCTCMAFKTLGYPCCHFYRVMTLTPIAKFHISLINNCWYKELLQGKNISNAIQMELSQIGDIEVSKVILKKRKFGELFGLGRKIISDVIEDGDEETYNEVLNFLQSIQQRRQRIFHNNNNVNVNIVGIQNPVTRIPHRSNRCHCRKICLEFFWQIKNYPGKLG